MGDRAEEQEGRGELFERGSGRNQVEARRAGLLVHGRVGHRVRIGQMDAEDEGCVSRRLRQDPFPELHHRALPADSRSDAVPGLTRRRPANRPAERSADHRKPRQELQVHRLGR